MTEQLIHFHVAISDQKEQSGVAVRGTDKSWDGGRGSGGTASLGRGPQTLPSHSPSGGWGKYIM